MAAKKGSTAPKKPSGRNVAEHERSGVKVQFRLGKAETEAIARLAAEEGVTINALAAWMVRMALAKSE
jgi:hypothetical protein